MSRRLLLVLTVAAVWRVAFLLSIEDTPLAYLHLWDQSDMATFVRQAELIAEGDWLAQVPHYPRHAWMTAIDAHEWGGWHPPTMFYQPPLYSYALAAVMAAGGDPVACARCAQLVLGVLACGLTYGLGRRLFGPSAGLAAGLLQAVYGPLIVTESQLLRDGPILFWTLMILCLAVDSIGDLRRGRMGTGEWGWRAWGLGLLVGVQAMAHESAMILGGVVLLWGLGNGLRRGGAGLGAAWLVLMLLGACVGYGPMLARNVTLGAPPAPQYFGSQLALATANHPDITPHTYTNSLPAEPGRFSETMRVAQGSPFGLMLRLVEDYGDEWPRALDRWGWRLLALSHPGEFNENLSYPFFQRYVPILALSFDFRWILPLAVAGALAFGLRRWRARMGGGAGLVWLAGLMTIALVSLVHPFGRYRLSFLPLLLPLAGWTPAAMGAALRARHAGRLAVLGLLVALVAVLQFGVGRVTYFQPYVGLRTTEFLTTSRILLRWNAPEPAAERLREGLEIFPDDPRVQIEWALAEAIGHHEAGRYDEAAEFWLRALAAEPEHPLATTGLERALAGEPLGRAVEQP